MNDDLLKSARNAAATIQAFYQWVDMINDAGGATSLEGVAKCHAFLTSMNKNRQRAQSLVLDPLNAAIAKANAA